MGKTGKNLDEVLCGLGLKFYSVRNVKRDLMSERPETSLRQPWLLRLILVMAVVVCVVFPKGGFVLSNIPVTWGYLFLGVVGGGVFLCDLIARRVRIPEVYFYSYILTLPFAGVVVSSLLLNGWMQTGFAVALLTNSVVLPFLFLILLARYTNSSETVGGFLRLVRIGVFVTALFGIILFFYRQMTGEYFSIPFVTTNGQQETSLEERHNARGEISKLISTYNNGNIYGICMLMLIPVCNAVGGFWFVNVFYYAAVFLTLSRTVWIGLLLNVCLNFLKPGRRFLQNVSLAIFCVIGLVFLILVYLGFSGRDFEWLLDSRLGGRIGQVESVLELDKIQVFPASQFNVITEMTYFSIVNNFGIIGIVFYLVAMMGPIFLAVFSRFDGCEKSKSIRNAAIQGAVIYLAVSFSDGAYLLIPVMSFYWFLIGLALRSTSMKVST